MIHLQDAAARRGKKILFTDATFTINPGEKVGVVGANGCGKSSLFYMLCNELQLDSGELKLPPKASISIMRQEIKHTDRPALEYVIDGDSELRSLEDQLQRAETAHDNNAIASAHAALDLRRAYEVPVRAQQIMAGLGFTESDHYKQVGEFSGGWRIRLNLARTLLQPADIMLLDEPTNHLDIDTIGWLEQWLIRCCASRAARWRSAAE